MLVKFDSLETKKVFANINSNCSENGYNISQKTGWGLEGVWLYENSNFTGNCSFFTTSQNYAPNWNVGNDKISSIKIVGSFAVRIYKDAYYTGGSYNFDTGWQNDYITKIDLLNGKINGNYDAYFAGLGLNDNISSISITKVQNCVHQYNQNGNTEAGIYFYSGDNQTGNCNKFPMQMNNGNKFFYVSNLSNWFVGTNSISSIKVIGGEHTGTAWNHIESGNVDTDALQLINSNQNTLLTQWNNNFESLQIIRNNNGTDTDPPLYHDKKTAHHYWRGGFSPEAIRNIKWQGKDTLHGTYNGTNYDYRTLATNAATDWNGTTGSINLIENGSGNLISVHAWDSVSVPGMSPGVAGLMQSFRLDDNQDSASLNKWIYANVIVFRDNIKTLNLTIPQIEDIFIHEFGHALSMAHVCGGQEIPSTNPPQLYPCNTDPEYSIMKSGYCTGTYVTGYDEKHLKERWLSY